MTLFYKCFISYFIAECGYKLTQIAIHITHYITLMLHALLFWSNFDLEVVATFILETNIKIT